MKIYELVLLDAQGRTLAEKSMEWAGEVAQCGGGKGGSTSYSSEPDYEYNARMAAIAERQQNLSDKFYNWWQDVQAPVEQATAKAQLGLIDDQTAIAQEGLDAFKGIQSQYYAAAQPTSVEAYAGRAAADAQRSLSSSMGTLARNNARMGVSPNSGAAQSANRNLAIQGAATLAGAANSGRLAGEQSNLEKLSGAMKFGLA